MKAPLIILGVLAVFPLRAADPSPFSPEPLGLQTPFRMQFPQAILPGEKLVLESDRRDDTEIAKIYFDLPLIVGPVRIDYGIPLRGEFRNDHFNFNMDGPGPGYREQRRRAITRERSNDHNT